MFSEATLSQFAKNPKEAFDLGMSKVESHVVTLRGPGNPNEDLLEKHPITGKRYVFYKNPVFQAECGFRLGSFEILGLVQAICLDEISKGSISLTDKDFYPLIEIDEDKEFSNPAPPEESNVRLVNLDTEDPDTIRSLIMEYARALLKNDIAIAESDEALCNRYLQFGKLVGGRATRTANFKIWAFTMFQALRLMGLSLSGLDDEAQRPLYTLKKEFNGAVDALELRLTDHFNRAAQSVESAPADNQTGAGVQQALLLAGSLSAAVRDKFLQPPVTKSGSSKDGEQPPSKKQRMSALLGALSSQPPARVSDTKARITGPKLLRAVTWPFKRVTLLEIHRELEAAGDSASRVEEVADGVFINPGKDTRTKLDSVAKIRTVITAIGTSLATVCPVFSPHTVSYGWTVLFRATTAVASASK